MYDEQFYDTIAQGCIKSAEWIAPIVHDMVEPDTVIDFGCGQGYWLDAFAGIGVSSVVGLDGDYVDRSRLAIPHDAFFPVNFEMAKTIDFGHFDLAISLEVAEHLPESRAEWFVGELCAASDFVLFSAAIPGQGGTGHVNEQWPGYWATKFQGRGYYVTGVLRWLIWEAAVRGDVENWYAQNMLLAVKYEVVHQRPELQKWFEGPAAIPFPVVHPVLYNARRS